MTREKNNEEEEKEGRFKKREKAEVEKGNEENAGKKEGKIRKERKKEEK